MKRLLKLENQIGRLGEKLVAAPQPTSRQNQWVVNEIRTILDKRMSEHSSKPDFTQHFTELFCGLENISKPSGASVRDPLAPEHTAQDIMKVFDEKYFKGQATFNFTKNLLMDKRIKDVEHFTRAVAQGGTILRSWTASQRELFQLHVANKLWVLGDQEGAKLKLASDYDKIWRSQLSASDLPKQVLELLARALIATRAVPIATVFKDIASNWRSIAVFWRLQFPTILDIDVSDSYLLSALNHVAEASKGESTKPVLPECLNFTPASAKNAPHQIRSALIRHAKDTRDTSLLDLLLASSEEEEDKVNEASVLLTKLALA